MKSSIDYIRAAIADMDVYIYCWDHKRPTPDQGTPDWWKVFDIVRGDCTRGQMEDYLAEK